ncbi:MAG: hypothetical protein EOP83_36440 [Verrucomicrobiaceae bacterium]|nr:MAG: hypothetical protein EOP83_36440 [Verrucomicrobiaceae bacterium]
MACRLPSLRDRLTADTRAWHLITVPLMITKAGTETPFSLFNTHQRWLEEDHAEGEYLCYSARNKGDISYMFSDLNTAMAFKLRFG